jgi:rubrerythrin
MALLSLLLLRSRYWRNKRPWGCKQCAYDLTGNTSGICPECGNPIPEDQARTIGRARNEQM